MYVLYVGILYCTVHCALHCLILVLALRKVSVGVRGWSYALPELMLKISYSLSVKYCIYMYYITCKIIQRQIDTIMCTYVLAFAWYNILVEAMSTVHIISLLTRVSSHDSQSIHV